MTTTATPAAIPLVDLRSLHQAIRGEIDEAIRRVVDRAGFIMGPEVEALEQEIAGYCHVPFAVGCASGSDALLLALMAIGVGPGDEVLCPPYTFFATAGSIARLGAIPVFADIDPVTYNLDPASMRAAAGRCRRLKAIMPVHLYGQCADMEAFFELGEEFELPVIEDAAQAIGSRDVLGRPAGSCCLIGCFSFYPTKNLGAFGDGGMLTVCDPALNERLRMLRVHGERTRYEHELLGFNSRLDAIQAAILRVKLRHLDRWTAARQVNAKRYDEGFAAHGAAASDVPLAEGGFPLRVPWRAGGKSSHIYNQYVIRVPVAQRDPLRAHLRQAGIGTEIYYPIPLHLQACFRHLGYAEGDLPESESAARETLALPIDPGLTPAQQDRVIETVVSFLR
jgi:dTDP-4-amino-4,6-dideoxygalactose transaminase